MRNNQTGRWRLFWVPVGYQCYMQWSTCRRWLRNMKKAKDSEIISWNLSYHRSSLNHFLKRSEAIESTWNLAFVTLRVKLINSEISREFSDLIPVPKKVATKTVKRFIHHRNVGIQS